MDENSELPLHLKYRPAIWEEIIGNEKAVGSLQAVIKSKARPHAFLLSGPSGCGKTSIGRIIAGELGAIGRDFHELNAGNFRGIDTARNLITGAWLRPWGGKATVFLLDEAHALTIEAQTALLKLLEEPPKHAYFILATTEPEKLLPTVLSRCTVFTVKRLPPNVVMGRLKEILKLEGNKETYPMNSVLRQISDKCAGSMREALNMLVQVKDHNNENYALELNAPQHLIPQRGSRGVASGHWNGNSSASIFSPTLVKRVGPGAAAYLNYALRRATLDADRDGWMHLPISQTHIEIGLARTAQRTAWKRLAEIGIIEIRSNGNGHRNQFRLKTANLTEDFSE